MALLYRYWLREFMGYFAAVQFIVLCIFVAVDYLSRLDRFLKAGYPLDQAFGYVLLKVPFMFVQLTPAGIVLSAIIVYGLMNRNNELLALRGAGISVFNLVKPGVFAGVVLALLMFILGETLVPITMSRANHIKYVDIKKKQNIYSAKEDIWIRGDRKILHLKYFDPADQTLSGISITFFDENFAMVRRLDARRGKFEKGVWHIFNVLEQSFEREGETTVHFHEEEDALLDIVPEDLQGMVKKSDEMGFRELASYIRKVEKEGYDATTYRVDLYGKTALPFICVIMVLTGAAAGMHSRIKESLPLGITLGIGVSFLYWIFYGFCTSLGYAKMLPPVVSAWAANIFFFCFSLIFIITAEE